MVASFVLFYDIIKNNKVSIAFHKACIELFYKEYTKLTLDCTLSVLFYVIKNNQVSIAFNKACIELFYKEYTAYPTLGYIEVTISCKYNILTFKTRALFQDMGKKSRTVPENPGHWQVFKTIFFLIHYTLFMVLLMGWKCSLTF